jgi:glycosyltransferase involved in cell wall biosynthesis
MLAGKPVVASKAGGVMEIVEDGVTGFLVNPGCVGELAAAVKVAVAGATVVAVAGQDLARVRFTVEATIRQITMALG